MIFGRIFVAQVFLIARITLLAGDQFPRDSDYEYDPPVPGSYALPAIKTAADGALLDSSGKAINLRELTHGRITVLGFIYSLLGAQGLSVCNQCI